jgi:hypothetical protein
MAKLCSNKLIVVGLKSDPEIFAASLELALFGRILTRDELYAVSVGKGPRPEINFKTNSEPPETVLVALSKKFRGVHFLLEYSCWESGFRGQMVICSGEVIERAHRRGYGSPTFLFADITHPLVQLWGPYIEPRTLEQQARNRLQDAIAIVSGLKQTLEDPRFADSPYRACGDEEQVIRVRVHLTVMLEAMTKHAKEISFDGVLVSDSSDDCYATRLEAEDTL